VAQTGMAPQEEPAVTVAVALLSLCFQGPLSGGLPSSIIQTKAVGAESHLFKPSLRRFAGGSVDTEVFGARASGAKLCAAVIAFYSSCVALRVRRTDQNECC